MGKDVAKKSSSKSKGGKSAAGAPHAKSASKPPKKHAAVQQDDADEQAAFDESLEAGDAVDGSEQQYGDDDDYAEADEAAGGDEAAEDDDDDEQQSPVAKRAKTEEEAEKSRASRAEQQRLLKERKLQKPHASLISEAKSIWEQVRQKRMTKPERRVLMNRMMELVGGRAKEIIFKHDASRIVQCCVKYGTTEQRDQIAEELKGQYARLSQSQYGRFIVSKILTYCPKYRNTVISDFYGKVRTLVRHKEASLVLDEAYSQFANASQRSALMEEFYGPEYAVFKKLDDKRSLDSLLASNPERKPAILRHLRQTLDSVLQKGSFNLGKTPILHRAVWEYVSHAETKVAADMIELLKDHLVHILHTRDGARVAQYCLLHASPKDRKHILKSFKGFVHAIAREQYGHAVLITAFETIDDTVIVSKTIVSELLTTAAAAAGTGVGGGGDSGGVALSISEILRDKYASRVVLFLLSGRNKRFQPAYLVEELQAMDAVRRSTSKKDDSLRRSQLLEAAAPVLVAAVAEHANELLRDRIGGQVLLETVAVLGTSASGVDAIMAAVVDAVAANLDPAGVVDEDEAMDTDAPAGAAAAATDDDDASVSSDDGDDDGDNTELVVKSGKAYNAVTVLKAERDAAKQAAQGLDMASSLLVNRSATFTLKALVSAKTPDMGAAPWRPALISSLMSVLAPVLSTWIAYCAADPASRSGTALIFVAMIETAGDALARQMREAVVAGGVDVAAVAKDAAAAVAAAREARDANEAAGAPAAKGKSQKRKRGDKESKAGSDKPAVVHKSAVETLLGFLSA
ncbi:armadillo-type protein [Entophlyctis helioformis]|nr:armadillo-type protein [Entophlyctis helioformis]